jgi:hypothetical protein
MKLILQMRKENLGDLAVNEKIILKCILVTLCVRVRNATNCFRKESAQGSSSAS